MRRIRVIFLVCCLATLVLAGTTLAHRVNVFAYVEGDTVHVECSYSKSSRVHGGEIEVEDAATGQVLLTGKTDDAGNFAFPVPQEARQTGHDLRIVLLAGEGHKNDWVVAADEYMNAPAPAETPAPTAPAALVPAPSVDQPAAPPTDALVLTKSELTAVVEAAVETKIAPLRRILLDQEEKGPGVTEIFGGIGYLVGLAGLLAYARSRKRDG